MNCVWIDLESTGVNVTEDRIIQIAACRFKDGSEEWFETLINPDRPIPPESTAIHKITDDMVRDKPKFRAIARELFAFLDGCVIGGFGVRGFDVPMLWEEFYRSGITWEADGLRIIDLAVLFKKKEERTLSAAYKFYCGRRLDEAHNAIVDIGATIEVFDAMRGHYPDVAAMTPEELHVFTAFDVPVDLAGKLIRNESGEICYSFGQKTKGVPVQSDPKFAYWMLSKDFPTQTKMVLRKILGIQEPAQQEMYD